VDHKILVTAIRREEPDTRLYMLALIVMAKRLQAEEAPQAESREEAPGGQP
jgi:hypothetical protein